MKKILFLSFLIIVITGCTNKQTNPNQTPSKNTISTEKETSKELNNTTVSEKPQNKNIDEQEECDTSKITDKSRDVVGNQKTYCVKNNLVYYKNTKIDNADMDSFEVLFIGMGEDGIAKDKNHVYRGTDIMPDLDAKTFTRLERNYFKDKNNIYHYKFGFGKLDFLDVNSFEVLGGSEGSYVKDEDFVYQDLEALEKLEGADPDTFTVINQFYAKDKNHVYVGKEMLEGANPETFKAEGNKIINN